MATKVKTTRIAVFFNLRPKIVRDRYEGVLRYASSRQDWEVRLNYELDLRNPTWLADGILMQSDIPQADAYRKLCARKQHKRVPLVAFDLRPQQRSDRDLEFVTDDKAIGQAAADHFLARGFTNFAYVGSYEASETRHCVQRERGFKEVLRKAGLPCVKISPDNVSDERLTTDRLAERLRQLPLPCAVFAYADPVSCMTLDACHLAGLAVPGQIAILGVDNDVVLCESRHPTLSSILPAFENSGHAAAEALYALIRGEDVPEAIRPVGVWRTVERESTADMRGAHRIAFAALRYMRENACDKLRTPGLAAALHVSQRLLEMRFRETFGCSVHDRILDFRLERAEQLLQSTSRSLPDIAHACGFTSVTGLIAAFRRRHNVSPGKWRRYAGTPVITTGHIILNASPHDT